MRFSAVILAGGKGERFKSSVSKQLMRLNGKPCTSIRLDVIKPLVDEVMSFQFSDIKNYKCVPGDATRSESAYLVTGNNGGLCYYPRGANPF